MPFTVNAGNGRLYPLTKESTAKEQERLDGLVEKGQTWAQGVKPHDYDGFFQINQDLIDYFQACFNNADKKDENGSVRLNWKGVRAKKLDGTPQFNIGDWWEPTTGEFRKFKKKDDSSGAEADDSFADVEDVFEDDEDIPF